MGVARRTQHRGTVFPFDAGFEPEERVVQKLPFRARRRATPKPKTPGSDEIYTALRSPILDVCESHGASDDYD
jgi:hypothetical protein